MIKKFFRIKIHRSARLLYDDIINNIPENTVVFIESCNYNKEKYYGRSNNKTLTLDFEDFVYIDKNGNDLLTNINS